MELENYCPKELESKAKEEEEEEEKGEEETERINLAYHEFLQTSWKAIGSSFENVSYGKMVEHQIESYNYFVQTQIPKTINMFTDIRIVSDLDFDPEHRKYALEVYMSFSDFRLHRPQIHENNGRQKNMLPSEARSRNFFYAANMFVDVNFRFVINKGDKLQFSECFHKKFPGIQIGKLPIMVRSKTCNLTLLNHSSPKEVGECDFDMGGYFIINGSEKAVIAQERGAENRVLCYRAPKNKMSKFSIFAEIKSIPDEKTISPKQFILMVSAKNNGFGFPILCQIPRVKVPIPIFILFRALGIVSDLEICNYILLNAQEANMQKMCQFLQASIVHANKCLSQEEALQFLIANISFSPSVYHDKEKTSKEKQHEFTVQDVLNHDFFPHCRGFEQKKFFLGYMAYRLIFAYFFPWKLDDRDSYLNKRIDLTGNLLNSQFRNHFYRLVTDAEKQILKEITNGKWRASQDFYQIITEQNIYRIIKSTSMEKLRNSLATGDFTLKQQPNASSKLGVAQVLNRLNYISSISNLRRVSTPQEKNGKLIEPRKLHATSFGFMCPCETPEGQSIGVVKNLSVMAHVTIPDSDNTSTLYAQVKPWVVKLNDVMDPRMAYGKWKVFINGNWYGIIVTSEAVDVYLALKEKKFNGIFSPYVSIVFDTVMKEIRICNDGGRVTRPVWRVRNDGSHSLFLSPFVAEALKRQEVKWDDLLTSVRLSDAMIEFIDAEEQAYSMIAMQYQDLRNVFGIQRKGTMEKLWPARYTHCEIHPSTIFGVLGSCTPFPDHNQSPRNTYQAAQGKQAAGIYVSNPGPRFDKTAYMLNHPSKPLVDTRWMNLMQMNRIPAGRMVIVAIQSWTGYNQEDSLIFNKGSLERGLFGTTIYHMEKDEDKPRMNGEEEIRMKPDMSKTVNIKMGANYSKLNSKGLLPVNTKVENNDVLIGKVMRIKESKKDPAKPKFTDHSKVHRTFENTFVDKISEGRNGEGYEFVKISLRTYRQPVIGDKFSSRHGQKGTIGNIVDECDMPYTKEGLRPDIIINPHAIPSRMTIGQLKETLLGKALSFLGLFGDGTAFSEINMLSLRQELQKRGFESNGNEVLYDGLTGNPFPSFVFIGPVFYQRLKHMVNDKIHSREIGPPLKMTRQPSEGRSRNGGFRFGEMERDCMIAHGASRFTQDRMYDASDKYQIYVCDKCGMIASVNHQERINICHMCRNKTDFTFVKIPYAAKLLFQQLMSMNVVPRIITQYSNFTKQFMQQQEHKRRKKEKLLNKKAILAAPK